jgi:GR25 family glycosyltransferase involved in LPS biosynthesis
MISNKDFSTYVINLERCKKKKEKISEMLKNNNLDFNIYNAVNSSNFTIDFIKNNNEIDKPFKEWLLKDKSHWGHLGCSMSHYNLLKQFIENDNKKFLLVLEDDCILDNNFSKKLIKILNDNINLNFDLLLCGYNCDSNYFNHRDHCILNKKYKQLNNNIRSINYFIGTHAYIINKNNAQKILNDCKPYIWCLDHQFSSFIKHKNYKIYAIFKPIAFSQGDNILTEWNYKKKIYWEFGSQTQSFNNKECFNGICKNNNLMEYVIIIIIVFVLILLLILKFSKKI